MTKNFMYGCVAVAVMMLAACSAGKKNLGASLQTNEQVFSGAAESMPQRVTPYTSMARAAKYNADTAVRNTAGKMYHEDENIAVTTKQIFSADLANDRLYNALRALDFVDVYAMSVLADDQNYIENSLYATSAQNLSISAIKLHRLDMSADSQLRDIDRLVNQQNKVLADLRQKDARNGFLTEQEISYRKGVETAVARLDSLKSKLQYDRSEYNKLVSASGKDVNWDGKRFYELEDFDKKYNFDVFADAAVGSRREFALAAEKIGSFNAARARRKAYVDYPPIARVDVNGLLVDGSRFDDALFAKAENLTNDMLEALQDYQSSPNNESVRQKAFDELCAVVLTQVEINYRLVEKAGAAYETNLYELGEIKKQIRDLEKKKNLSDNDKVELLNLRVKQMRAEYDSAEYSGDRAAALRGLYYSAGLSPFDKTVLKQSVGEIETILKKSFNQDMERILADAQKQEKWNDGGNSWAHQDNWLENLVDEPRKMAQNSEAAKQKKVVAEPADKQVRSVEQTRNVEPQVNNYEGKTIIQLGAYTDVENADDDKRALLSAVKSLSNYNIYFEDALVNGVTYHRMVLKPEPDKLGDLCNEIISAGYDCLTR